MDTPAGSTANAPPTARTASFDSGNGSDGNGESDPMLDVRQQIVAAATRAPSVHNTQPWRFASCPDGLDLYADEARRLPVMDPRGRQLHLSCGAALQHAQVAARALGLTAEPQLLPDRDDPSHLARLRLAAGPAATAQERELADAIELRHTYRDAFVPQPLPDALLERLRAAAEAQGAYLRVITHSDDLLELQTLLYRADRAEGADPAYRQELASWVRTGPADDGIPRAALPVDAERGSSLRLRDFAPPADPSSADPSPADPSSIDPSPAHSSSAGPQDGDDPPVAARPDVVVVISDDDTPLSWLRAGQALGAVLLQAAHDGVMAQPLAQATDLPGSRQRLRATLGLVGTPQLALRIGYATGTAATPRRDLADVLDRQDQEPAGG